VPDHFGQFKTLMEQAERSRANFSQLREWLVENVSEYYMADHWVPRRLPEEVENLVANLDEDIARIEHAARELHEVFVWQTYVHSLLFVRGQRQRGEPDLEPVDFHLMLARIADIDPTAVLPHCQTCECG